jgi:hypothetical protein
MRIAAASAAAIRPFKSQNRRVTAMRVLFGTAVFGLVAVPPLPVCAEARGATVEAGQEPVRLELPACNAAQDTSTAEPAPESGDDIDAALTPDPQRG